MEVTFGKFWNLLESEENSKALDLIRSGNSIRNADCGNFWEDFANLCGNAEAMSELLDVPKEKVTAWSGHINKLREEARNKDSNNKKDKIIKNGEL